MKIKIIIYLFLFSSIAFAQMHTRMKEHNRLEELEKIKLIEELNLNEETSARFVARLNENKNKMHEIQERKIRIIGELEKNFQSNEQKDSKYFIEKNNVLLDLENELRNNREKFLRSLSDILTPEQISKVMVFEVKFREQIKSAIIKREKRN